MDTGRRLGRAETQKLPPLPVDPAAPVLEAAPEREAPSAGRHVILMVASSITVAVINYALNIILGWTLPVEEYGRVGVSQTLIFICVWLVSAGFPWVVTRAIAQASHPGQGPDDSPAAPTIGNSQFAIRNPAAWQTYKSAWAAGTLLTLGVVALLVGAFYVRLLPLEPVYAPLIVIVGVTAGALGIGSVPSAALQGLFRFGSISALRVFEALVNIVVSVALVIAGLGAGGALAGFAASAVLSSSIVVWLLRDTRFWKVHGWGSLGALRVALPMTLAVFGGVLLTNIDLLAIKFLSGAASSDALSGAYQVAAVLARAPLFVGTALVTTFYPRVARDAVGPNAGDTSPAGRELMKWMLLGVLPINVIMVVGAPAVVTFFFPERYASSAGILAVLAIGSAFLVVAGGLASILQAMHRVAVPAIAMSGAVVLEVLGLWLLTPSYGALGAALSSASTSAMACALLLWYSRHMRLAPPRPARHAVALAALALPMAALMLLFARAGRPLVAIWVASAGAIYLIVVFALNLVTARDLVGTGNVGTGSAAGALVARFLGAVDRLNRLGER